VVAHAAVTTLIDAAERVPAYTELKQYRAESDLVACRRVTITRLLASNVSWPLAVKSCSRSNSIPT